MVTLYHLPQSRSSRFIWLLEELATPYEVRLVPMRRRDGSGQDPDPRYRTIHPHGKVPAITHNGVTVFESAAIALYLSDEFPAAGLGVPIGHPLRGPLLTWLAYYAGVMEPAFVGKALGFTTTNSTTGWAPTEDVLAYVTAKLEEVRTCWANSSPSPTSSSAARSRSSRGARSSPGSTSSNATWTGWSNAPPTCGRGPRTHGHAVLSGG